MNQDWLDFLAELQHAGVRYLVVGAHALGAHGGPRGTVDLDVWIDPTRENAERLIQALAAFGAPVEALGIARADFSREDTVHSSGCRRVASTS